MRDRLIAEPLTRDHKLNLPDEKDRIEKHGRIVFDGHCHRVATKHSMTPGLNMSRSLGDVLAHSSCGVSDVPDVVERTLTFQDRALLLCSDGIWEVMTPQDFGPWRAMEAAKKLADEAMQRWLNGTHGKTTDDVTVVLVWLRRCPGSPTSSQGETCSTDIGPLDSTDSSFGEPMPTMGSLSCTKTDIAASDSSEST